MNCECEKCKEHRPCKEKIHLSCGCKKPKCNCPKPCGCEKKCGCQKPCKPRVFIDQCQCDPCQKRESMVKICTFVADTLDDARLYRDAFVFVREDESVYYISDLGNELPFGSRPVFKDDFEPRLKAIPRQTVFDFKNNIAYVYSPTGEVRSFALNEVEESDAD